MDSNTGREPRISSEEIERRLRLGGDRSLAEILASLEPHSSRSPFSDEELQRRRQQRSGRSLMEILEQLGR